ncbi:MAG: hypothetical protein MJZ76_08440 [Bacteroidales bacterium]|nr:hypothetical protein [Bacteroidales bacterium]
MRKFIFSIITLSLLVVSVSCRNHEKEEVKPVVSFNPEDKAAVNELLTFYIDNDIILPSMLRCEEIHKPGEPHTYDCLKDGCEIAHDYLQDSLSSYFFMELNCMAGSCGNDIYIFQKQDSTYNILFNECGTIDQDLGHDTLINHFKVLYYEKELKNYRIIFDGENFISEEL